MDEQKIIQRVAAIDTAMQTVLDTTTDLEIDTMVTQQLDDLADQVEALQDLFVSRNQSPITRWFYHDREEPSISNLTVDELMDENAGYEDSAWAYLEALSANGIYDDSDPSWDGVQCVYRCGSKFQELLYQQMSTWHVLNPEIVGEFELAMPARPSNIPLS